jgi:hypothetical protein
LANGLWQNGKGIDFSGGGAPQANTLLFGALGTINMGSNNGSLALVGSAHNNTSGSGSHIKQTISFTPASGTASWAAMQILPTINGTSSGKAAGLAIASLTNTLTGGSIRLLDVGTTTTDYFTGFTSKFAVTPTGISFFNVTAAAQQTGGAAAAGVTYGATEQSMLQKAYDCLRTFGLLN